MKTGLRIGRCARERSGVPCRGGNGRLGPVRPDSVLVSLVRSDETRPRAGAGRADAGPRAEPCGGPPPRARPNIPSCFPCPRNAKSWTPRVTLSLATPGSPAVLRSQNRVSKRSGTFPLPHPRCHGRFGPLFVWPEYYTELMDRQRRILVGFFAIEGGVLRHLLPPPFRMKPVGFPMVTGLGAVCRRPIRGGSPGVIGSRVSTGRHRGDATDHFQRREDNLGPPSMLNY